MQDPSPPSRPSAARDPEEGRRLALVTSTAGIGYWSLERGQERATWSAELRRMHGLAEDDPVPSFDDWMQRHVHPEDRAGVYHGLHDWPSAPGASVRRAFRILAVDGTVREIVSHSMLEETDDRRALFGVVIDLTSMRNTERALRQAESRAALSARAVGMGTWDLDLRNGDAHWDAQMWRLRGCEPKPAAPTHAERLAFVHPDDRGYAPLLAEAGAPQAYEFRVVWPDGQVRWLASRSTILVDEDGAPVRRIGVNWDVTASRAAEAALRERELALRESESRTRILARISHELRTPLNAILGFAQLLQRDEDGADEASRRRRSAVGQIAQAGDHLLALVDRVLELTESRPPVAPADAAASAVVGYAPTGAQRTVLYIEDNAVNTMIVAELVERRGDLRFESASTGAEGLARAFEMRPALILLDMQLPDIDGPEVFQRLRADPRTAAIPCIALSANALPADIDAARSAGMTDYWTKPFDFDVFAQALDRLFGPPPRAA